MVFQLSEKMEQNNHSDEAKTSKLENRSSDGPVDDAVLHVLGMTTWKGKHDVSISLQGPLSSLTKTTRNIE